MRELPILMNGAMVRAVLEGRKTVMRRLVNLDRSRFDTVSLLASREGIPYMWHATRGGRCDERGDGKGLLCPFGEVGDRLYVRETWRPHGDAPLSECTGSENIMFHAGLDEFEAGIFEWRPSIHMPKWATRIWLEVTAVRVERLRDITPEQAIAEGMTTNLREGDAVAHLRYQFGELWDGLAKPGTRWADNPWVWVVEFRRIEHVPGQVTADYRGCPMEAATP
jgi:hypothetical protein